MGKKTPDDLISQIDQIFKKKRTGKEKRLFIIVGAIVGMFLVYNLFLSPYAQCVSGYVKINAWKTTDQSATKAKAKIHCKALGR